MKFARVVVYCVNLRCKYYGKLFFFQLKLENLLYMCQRPNVEGWFTFCM